LQRNPTATAAGPTTSPHFKETQMKKFAAVVGVTLSLAFVNAAVAHPDEDDMPDMRVKQVQLDVKKTADGATVLATLDGDSYSTAGATGTLTLTKGKRKQVVALQPSGANAMKTQKAVKIAKGSQAKAAVTFADKSIADAYVIIN
jgi:hypothetical protein